MSTRAYQLTLMFILSTSCSAQSGPRPQEAPALRATASPAGSLTVATASSGSAPSTPSRPRARLASATTPERAPIETSRFATDPNETAFSTVLPAHPWQGPDPCGAKMPNWVPASVLRLEDISDGGGAGFEAKSLLSYCWPTQGGVWALLPHGYKRKGEYAVLDRVKLVFARDNGSILQGPDFPFEGGNVDTTFFAAVPLSSAKNEPRVALFSARGFHNGGHREGAVYALRGNRIVPLALPQRVKHIVAAGDVDRDGIDDLLTDSPFTYDYCGCACTGDTTVQGSWLLLHGNPKGNYSMVDEVAVEWAKTQCPQLPGDLVGEEPNFDWIRCQRLWGATSRAIDDQLTKYCQLQPVDDQDMCAPCTIQRPLWQVWAAAEPPFVLH